MVFFVMPNVCLDRSARHGFTNHIQKQVCQLAETNAALAHVEPFSGGFVTLAKPLLGRLVAVSTHQVDGPVVFLRGQRSIAERLFVVGDGVPLQGDGVRNHAPVHSFFVAFGQVFEEDLADSGDGRSAGSSFR